MRLFEIPVTPTLKSINTSPTMLQEPENFGVAIGMSLLSYIQAEIYDIAYALPVNGGYVWFTGHADVEEYLH